MQSRRIKLILSYDGSCFFGWQIQNEGRTVQGVLEDGLGRMHKKPVRVTAAGRTDSGVHAKGQVCHFDSNLNIDGSKFKDAVNSFLPDDIYISESAEVDTEFHARFNATKRVYKYYLSDSGAFDIFNRSFCTTVRNLPPLNLLNACAGKLEGIHDFTTFTAVGDKSKSRTREIFSAVFYRERGMTVFRIEGNAFLWRMIRSVVGSILKYANEEDGEAKFLHALMSRDRNLAGPTAPAGGLVFHRVYY